MNSYKAVCPSCRTPVMFTPTGTVTTVQCGACGKTNNFQCAPQAPPQPVYVQQPQTIYVQQPQVIYQQPQVIYQQPPRVNHVIIQSPYYW